MKFIELTMANTGSPIFIAPAHIWSMYESQSHYSDVTGAPLTMVVMGLGEGDAWQIEDRIGDILDLIED